MQNEIEICLWYLLQISFEHKRSLILFLHTHNFTPNSFTSLYSHLPITYYMGVGDMSYVTHTWTYTRAHHIQAQLCMTSAAHPQDDLWNPTVARVPLIQQEYPPQATHILFALMQLVQLCFIPAQLGLQIQHLGLGCPLSGDCSFSSLFHLHRTILLKWCLWKNVFSLLIAHKSPLKFNWHILIHKQRLSLVLFSVANWIQFFNSTDKQH